MTLYKNKYRIETTRLKDWNYSSHGYYFITICTKSKKCFFGNVHNEEMYLSEIGKTSNQHWLEIPEHFENVNLGEFIIMPNHIHGIIIINNDGNIVVETRHGVSLRKSSMNKFSKPVKGSLSVIINHFKSSVTRCCHKNGYFYFSWQSRFYDHIIRNEKSLKEIREYIINNPAKWELDEYNPRNF